MRNFPLTMSSRLLKSRSSSRYVQVLRRRDNYWYSRAMSSSSSSGGGNKKGKNKNKALQRQRNLNPTTAELTSSSTTARPTSTDNNHKYISPTVSPSSFSTTGIKPTATPISEFQTTTGLAKLHLPSDIHPNYFNDDEIYDGVSSSNTTSANRKNNSSSSLLWETNKKLITPSTSTATSQLLLRNSSTLLNKKNHDNDDDDGFLVDRDAMFDPLIHLPHAPKDWKGYEPATPLSEFLMARIGVSGQPITTAEYMRHALTHPLHGYYTSSSSRQNKAGDDDWDDVDEYGDDDEEKSSSSSPNDSSSNNNGRSTIFGRGGDFVTAPELSSVFGHSLCVWFMTVWQQEPLGKPADIQFVELGPGRGTLMADLLELAHSSLLLDFGQAIRTVHFVESSLELRLEQQQTLKKVLGHLVRLDFTGYTDDDNNKNDSKEKSDKETDDSFVNTIRIVWHDDFSSFQSKRDKSIPTMVVMQEFIDALPVHQFQKTEDGWRERMIDVASADATKEEVEHFSSSAEDDGEDQSVKEKQLIPRLRQVLAPQVTPAVELLMSSNYDQYDQFPEGTVVEICPDAIFLAQDVARVLEESQGAALIIDYGEEGTTDTLRAFSRHNQVPLTSRPGQVDVTADVDFFALKKCLSTGNSAGQEKNSNTEEIKDNSKTTFKGIEATSIHAFGPIQQGEFLMRMGAAELTMKTIEKPETTDDQAQAFTDALKYLVMPEHMGGKFKVLALARKRDGLFGPPGIE
ncbi:MAG: NADH dehydrogenase [ubiquinone] 1 alpha subcomplex assembly factor 7 [Bacillariaceae sp.]|jgi:NADH dehydrogenase [ubiquinone] 1 alpha subcomplex assembly factor 7